MTSTDLPVTTTPAKPPSAVAVKFTAFAEMVKNRTADFATLLPAHMPKERFARCLLNYAIRAPEVLECTPPSIVKSMLDAAQMGLAPDGLLGSGYLIARRMKDKATGHKVMQCTFMPGYRGLVDLARRSGTIQQISGQVVREGDVFEYELGDTPRLRHVPKLEGYDKDGSVIPHRPIIAAYAVALLTDGSKQVEVLTLQDLDKIRACSESGDSEFSPWSVWPEEQSRKSAVKRLCKYLPLSPELALAIQHDNVIERGGAGIGTEAAREVETARAHSGQRMAELAQQLAEAGETERPGDSEPPPDEPSPGGGQPDAPTPEQLVRAEGAAAAARGDPTKMNPHKAGTAERQWWATGYAAEIERAAKSERTPGEEG